MADAILIDYVSEEPATAKASGDLCQQQGPLTTSAASSAEITITNVPAIGEVFVTFVISGNPVRMNFSTDPVTAVAAADPNSAMYPVGKYRFRITAATKRFRHIQQTGAGEINFWRSSR